MRHLAASTAALVVALIGAAQAAPTYTVQTVQFPTDPTFTQLLGINDQDTIVGYHGAAVNKGFTLTLPSGFTDTNFPGSAQTQVTGIASATAGSDKVGFYVDTAGATHGFINIPGGLQPLRHGGSARHGVQPGARHQQFEQPHRRLLLA